MDCSPQLERLLFTLLKLGLPSLYVGLQACNNDFIRVDFITLLQLSWESLQAGIFIHHIHWNWILAMTETTLEFSLCHCEVEGIQVSQCCILGFWKALKNCCGIFWRQDIILVQTWWSMTLKFASLQVYLSFLRNKFASELTCFP